MVKLYQIKKRDKLLVKLPLMRDRSQPYNEQTINVFNEVFRAGQVPVLGNCNWGDIEVLCWGFQYHEFIEKMVKANKADFTEEHVTVTVLQKWPTYPINATGDCDLTGIDSPFSYPTAVIKARKELDDLDKKIQGRIKALELLTGEKPNVGLDGRRTKRKAA